MEDGILIKTYQGQESEAIIKYERESNILRRRGYQPTSQSYQQGQWGCGSFLLAVFFCLFIVGVLALIYMIIVKPEGTLTVTYKMINKNEIDFFITSYVEHEQVLSKERDLRVLFEKVSNNNFDLTNEDISIAISKINRVIKENISVTDGNNICIHESIDDEILIRIRKLNLLMAEGVIDIIDYNEKKKEILSCL